eukprot:SAG22_NODE_5690_length_970_cov_18.195178_1_plen_119_part_00
MAATQEPLLDEADVGALISPAAPAARPPAAQRRGASRQKQLNTLIRQKLLLKRREWGSLSGGVCGCPAFCPCALFCELLLPIGLILFLYWAQGKCTASGQCELVRTAGWGSHMPEHSV